MIIRDIVISVVENDRGAFLLTIMHDLVIATTLTEKLIIQLLGSPKGLITAIS